MIPISETVQRKGEKMKDSICIEGEYYGLEALKSAFILRGEELISARETIQFYVNKNEELKHRISELETELRVKEDLFKIKGAISEGKPSVEWYEDRHQSDCITINQLHTTIDVLTDKLTNLRKQMCLC